MNAKPSRSGAALIGCQGGDRNPLPMAAWLTDIVTLNDKSSHEQT
jgi:hypothetical protein